jgi:F-type H+-transporting ATPase subunit delta
LFAILSDNREQNLLMDIAEAYEVLRTDELQILGATIFTAESLSEDDYNSIRESLAKSTGKKIEINSEVNPDLVGGLKLRLGNLFIDGSIRGRLDSLKRELTIT